MTNPEPSPLPLSDSGEASKASAPNAGQIGHSSESAFAAALHAYWRVIDPEGRTSITSTGIEAMTAALRAYREATEAQAPAAPDFEKMALERVTERQAGNDLADRLDKATSALATAHQRAAEAMREACAVYFDERAMRLRERIQKRATQEWSADESAITQAQGDAQAIRALPLPPAGEKE